MVLVTDIEARTTSAEAVKYLLTNMPIQISADPGTKEFADEIKAINAQIADVTDPALEGLRAKLDLHVQERDIAGARVVVITPRTIKSRRKKVAGFYVHGGGFALLSAHNYKAYRMAHDLGIVVYSVDYSLSPQVQFPVALDETFDVYRAVSDDYRSVLAAGFSAGGNLLATIILRSCRGDANPPKAVALSAPEVDLRAIGYSYVANDGRDPLVTRNTLIKLNTAYLGATSPTNPKASPLLADYKPWSVPTMITTGNRDLLQSDSLRFYWQLREEAHAQVRLRVWEGMWHGFEEIYPPEIPEGEQNLREIFGFLEEHI
jgi:monoterpene epsilon-lactone hydrolase